MKELNENTTPDPKKIEKELGEFLNKKFGGNVRIVSPPLSPEKNKDGSGDTPEAKSKKKLIDFNIKPQELVSYLDQYIVKQDKAKSVLSTKICTHFNRIKYTEESDDFYTQITGNIKSNILMLGPTGIGKTYIIKLIAKKLGVPFVKADATKFSETGYVGGDVEDLVRDLVKEADNDIELAQCGIIYIDEIDKIASSNNVIGAQVSRSGVQRALLKPMEETDVDLKVPHDPVSMMQELDRYQKTGKRDKKRVNTGNILFIVSGAFSELTDVIKERISKNPIGFGADLIKDKKDSEIFKKVKAEDLVKFGFESEFIGRLPIRCILDTLTEDDLFSILKMPNNPVVLGKRLDFASYGINLVFTDNALRILAKKAHLENTGARGLVSVVEEALLGFEEKLPSTNIKRLAITENVLNDTEKALKKLLSQKSTTTLDKIYIDAKSSYENYITEYITDNWKNLSLKHGLTLSKYRSELVAKYFCSNVSEIGDAVDKVKSFHEQVKQVEVDIFNSFDLNIIFEEDAVDFLIEQFINFDANSEEIIAQIYEQFYDGLNLIREKTGTRRFFLTEYALNNHELFLDNLIKKEIP
ncbi:MAG: AAA domain-containing protein [Desulfobacteraceae bacterium]|nr:AAA domain-containing protein [Desulfobacteraceae bacterium]